MPGIPSSKPRTRTVNIRSLSQAVAGREAAYPVYRFSRRAFFELPSRPAQTFSGTDAPLITDSDPTGIEATADYAGYQFQADTASGQAATWSVDPTGSPLPAGLDLSSTGLLTGTPTEAGSSLVTVIATDPVTGAFTMVSTVITVEPSPVSFSAGAAPNSQQIDTAYAGYNYVAIGGTGPYVYTVSAGGLPSGMTLSSVGLLSGTPDAAGVSIATIRATDNIGQYVETVLTFSVVLPAAPEITSGVPSNPQRAVAYGGFTVTGTGFGTPTWDFSGVVPAGMTLDLNGTNQLTGTPTDFGFFPWTLRLTDIYGQQDEQSFVLEVDQAPAPVITSGAPGPFDEFVAITPFTFTASGGAGGYSWSIIGELPAGVTFDGTDTISGLPLESGVFPITVVVDDALGVQTTQVYDITFVSATAPIFVDATPEDGAVDGSYSYQYSATSSFTPLIWSINNGTLPPGLSFSPTGLLSGTPTTDGSYSFAVQAVDQFGQITVQAPPQEVVIGPPVGNSVDAFLAGLGVDHTWLFDEASGDYADSGAVGTATLRLESNSSGNEQWRLAPSVIRGNPSQYGFWTYGATSAGLPFAERNSATPSLNAAGFETGGVLAAGVYCADDDNMTLIEWQYDNNTNKYCRLWIDSSDRTVNFEIVDISNGNAYRSKTPVDTVQLGTPFSIAVQQAGDGTGVQILFNGIAQTISRTLTGAGTTIDSFVFDVIEGTGLCTDMWINNHQGLTGIVHDQTPGIIARPSIFINKTGDMSQWHGACNLDDPEPTDLFNKWYELCGNFANYSLWHWVPENLRIESARAAQIFGLVEPGYGPVFTGPFFDDSASIALDPDIVSGDYQFYRTNLSAGTTPEWRGGRCNYRQDEATGTFLCWVDFSSGVSNGTSRCLYQIAGNQTTTSILSFEVSAAAGIFSLLVRVVVPTGSYIETAIGIDIDVGDTALLSATQDGDDIKLYLNGQLLDSTPTLTGTADTDLWIKDLPTQLGFLNGMSIAAGSFVTGLNDWAPNEFGAAMFCEKALSATEHLQAYQATQGIF